MKKFFQKDKFISLFIILISLIISILIINNKYNQNKYEFVESVPNITEKEIINNQNNTTPTTQNIRLYIKSKIANVRECPSTTCKIIGEYYQNTPFDFEFQNFTTLESIPEWLEIKWQENNSIRKGYINRINFSLVPIINYPSSKNSEISNLTNNFENRQPLFNYNQIVKTWYRVVAYVNCYKTDSSMHGAGTLLKDVNGEYVVLTNKHVVEGADFCFVGFLSTPSEGFQNLIFFIAWPPFNYFSPKEDIVRLSLSIAPTNIIPKDITWAFASSLDILQSLVSKDNRNCLEKPDLGDEVVILGYPTIGNQYGITISRGIISGIEGNYFVTDAKIEQGNSGGAAILLKYNCYLGIPTYGIRGKLESFSRIFDVTRFSVPAP